MYLGNTPTQQAFTPAVDTFSGNGSTTAFTLSRSVASVAQVEAVIENVVQSPVDAYTVSGNTITFTSAPPSGSSNIYVRYTSPITQVVQPTDGSVNLNTLSSAVTTAFSGYGMKNRIINGAMLVNQRGFSGTATDGGYTLDRFACASSQASKFSVAQSSNAPAGFSNSLLATSLSAYSVGAGDFFAVDQFIEGFNTADLAWGTANAATVTLSFKVYSSLTGTFGGAIINSAFNYSYPFSYSIPVANTWTTISVTIAGPTSGTWIGATNGVGMRVYFGLGVGSTYSGTAGSWAGSLYFSATGATSVVGTNGATFYITGVQLEKGSTATSFDYRPYGTELALCQRYYYRLKAGSSYANAGTGRAYSTTNSQAVISMPVSMRAAPTGGYSALSDWNAAQASGNITALSPASQYSLDYRQMTIDVTATMVSGQTVILNANNTTNAWIDWSAEL